MSFVGILMKMIIDASGFQILFYRSMSLSLVVIIFACIITKSNPKNFIKRLDKFDLLMGIFLSLDFATYVFSMLHTSVASTLFILGITPFLAAIIAWYYLKEKPKIIVCNVDEESLVRGNTFTESIKKKYSNEKIVTICADIEDQIMGLDLSLIHI